MWEGEKSLDVLWYIADSAKRCEGGDQLLADGAEEVCVGIGVFDRGEAVGRCGDGVHLVGDGCCGLLELIGGLLVEVAMLGGGGGIVHDLADGSFAGRDASV